MGQRHVRARLDLRGQKGTSRSPRQASQCVLRRPALRGTPLLWGCRERGWAEPSSPFPILGFCVPFPLEQNQTDSIMFKAEGWGTPSFGSRAHGVISRRDDLPTGPCLLSPDSPGCLSFRSLTAYAAV